MIAEEITSHVRRNRLPIIVWSCIVILPALLVGIVVAGWHSFHPASTSLPGSIAEISATPSDRTWSIFQAFDCIQSSCADEQSAKAVIISASADTVSLSTDTKTETITPAALSDTQWATVANQVTNDGSITVSSVVSAVKDAGATSAAFTVGTAREAYAFSSGKRAALTSIVIGGAE